jgi:hypothetical protein
VFLRSPWLLYIRPGSILQVIVNCPVLSCRAAHSIRGWRWRLMMHGSTQIVRREGFSPSFSMFGRCEKEANCCKSVEILVLSRRAGDGLMVNEVTPKENKKPDGRASAALYVASASLAIKAPTQPSRKIRSCDPACRHNGERKPRRGTNYPSPPANGADRRVYHDVRNQQACCYSLAPP